MRPEARPIEFTNGWAPFDGKKKVDITAQKNMKIDAYRYYNVL